MDSLFIKSFLPEIFLCLCILYQLICNSRLVNSLRFSAAIINIELFWQGSFILICLVFLFYNQKLETYDLGFLFIFDCSSAFCKLLLTIILLFSFVSIWKSFVTHNINFFEYFSLYFLSILGSFLLISCYDLISVYIVIELQALSFYVMACFKRTSSFSVEAGLKYFVLGSLVSGLFLLGAFFIYSSLGTLNLQYVGLLLAYPIEDSNKFLYYTAALGALLVLVTFLFKVAAAPFHFWAPDVYEGAPLPSSIAFSILPKLAIFIFLMRFCSVFLDNLFILQYFLILVGLFSVFWGAILSIGQKRLKRFIIYSSISQVGFLVTALSYPAIESYTSIFFFLIIYLISSIILWNGVVVLNSFNKAINTFNLNTNNRSIFLSDLSSYFKSNYIWSLSFLLLFFSFAGIPPLSGFLSKFLILFSLVVNNNVLTSLFLILLSIISSYYYLRIIKILFFDTSLTRGTPKYYVTVNGYSSNNEALFFSSLLFLLIFFFFFPSILILVSGLVSIGYFLI